MFNLMIASISILCLSLLLFLVVVIVIASYRKEQKIERQLKKIIAPRLKATYVGHLNSQQIRPSLLPLLIARFGVKGEIKNLLKGKWQKIPYEIFTYTYERSKGEPLTREYHTVVAVPTWQEPLLPKFLIRPPEFLDGFKEMIGYEFVNVPAAENVAIQVYQKGVDNQIVFKNVPSEIWQEIGYNSLTLINDGTWFIAYQYNRRLDPMLYLQFLTTTLDIYTTFLNYSTLSKIV